MAAKDVEHKLHRFSHQSLWAEMRLKRVVQEALPALGSRSALLVIANGLVSIDGGATLTNADAQVPEGAVLLVDLRHGVHGPGKPKHPHLHERMQVVHDDEHIVVVNKQAGTIVQPVRGKDEEETGHGVPLVELLKHYWRANSTRIVNPTVVQRLDVETSGLLVLAKSVDAARELQRQLMPPRKLRREYLALAAGKFLAQKGVWKTHMGRGPLGLRQSVAESTVKNPTRRDLQFAETRFEVLEQFEKAALLRLRIETGRTHQIRIHCAEAGHPLLGDGLYAKLAARIFERLAQQKYQPRSKENSAMEAQALVESGQLEVIEPKHLPPRIALHSERLSFIHPGTRKLVKFEQPLPDDLQRYLDRLRAGRAG